MGNRKYIHDFCNHNGFIIVSLSHIIRKTNINNKREDVSIWSLSLKSDNGIGFVKFETDRKGLSIINDIEDMLELIEQYNKYRPGELLTKEIKYD
jgi:hypothetical protein